MKVSFYLLSLLILIGCSAEPKLLLMQDMDQDFCESIHRDTSIHLSHQLELLADSMQTQTGVYVLEDGDGAMVSRAWLTEYAEKTIDIQYFIFSADNVGLIACDYLVRAADRGVQVRLIVDDILVEADAYEMLALDSHENLSIKIYNPSINVGKNLSGKLVNLVTDFRGINQRMHNKTFTVDGQIVITGGRNIADEYFDYNHEYNFRDRDVLLLGGAAKDVQDSFEEYWNHPLSKPVAELVSSDDPDIHSPERFNYLHQYACNPENFWPQVREKIKNVPKAFEEILASGQLQWVDKVEYISDKPGKNDESSGLGGGGKSTAALIKLIKEAKQSVSIQTPYLVTTELGQGLFAEAVQRGVEVKILTNSLSSTDNLEAFSGYQRDRKKLLQSGIKIFEFRPDAAVRFEMMTSALQTEINYVPIFGLHAKSMVIDNSIAVIGTFNLDPRSANLNTECITIIHDEKIAAALGAVMDEEVKPENAWKTTLESNPDVYAGWKKRLKTWTRRIVPKKIL